MKDEGSESKEKAEGEVLIVHPSVSILTGSWGTPHPVATTTPRGLPAREPRSAPGSDFLC